MHVRRLRADVCPSRLGHASNFKPTQERLNDRSEIPRQEGLATALVLGGKHQAGLIPTHQSDPEGRWLLEASPRQTETAHLVASNRHARDSSIAHLTSRTCGKRQPELRQATSVPAEAFSSNSNGPSTSSLVQRGHLQPRRVDDDRLSKLN